MGWADRGGVKWGQSETDRCEKNFPGESGGVGFEAWLDQGTLKEQGKWRFFPRCDTWEHAHGTHEEQGCIVMGCAYVELKLLEVPWNLVPRTVRDFQPRAHYNTLSSHRKDNKKWGLKTFYQTFWGNANFLERCLQSAANSWADGARRVGRTFPK